MNIDLAVLDIAGTTVQDSNDVAGAFVWAFENHGIRVDASMVRPLMGYAKPVAIQTVLEKTGHPFDHELIEAIHRDFRADMLDFYAFSPAVQPMAGAEDLFLYLKEQNVKVALNTGFSREIAEVILERFQWMERGLIDEFVASDEVGRGRPFPDMINVLKKRTGVGTDALLMKVGDTTVDMEEGTNAGCRLIIGVTTGACTQQELETRKPTHIVERLSQIPEILQNEPAYER